MVRGRGRGSGERGRRGGRGRERKDGMKVWRKRLSVN